MRLPSMRLVTDQERLVAARRRAVSDHLRRAREAALDRASRPGSLAVAFALGGVLGWKRPAPLRASAGPASRPALRALIAGGFQLGLRMLPYVLWRARVHQSHQDAGATDVPPAD